MSVIAPAISQAPIVADDLGCVRCGYNLRTLSADDRCPECSTPVPATLDPKLLRNTDPSWTSILAFALALITAGTFFDLVEYAITAAFVSSPDNNGALVAYFFAAAATTGRQLFWIGLLLLASSHPSIHLPMRLRVLRVLVRALAIIGIIITLATSLRFSWTEFGFGVDLAASGLLFLYLLYIARLSGSRRLIRHTWIALLANIIAHGIWIAGMLDLWEHLTKLSTAAYWLASAMVLYQFLYFYLFRRVLRRSTTFARQYWHFCSPITSRA
jgi:hypothetical protein